LDWVLCVVQVAQTRGCSLVVVFGSCLHVERDCCLAIRNDLQQ
jgi:hypothetical protein